MPTTNPIVDSRFADICVPRYVDFSRIDEVRAAVDCDGYFARAMAQEIQRVPPKKENLPDISKLRIASTNVKCEPIKAKEPSTAAPASGNFMDLAMVNPSTRLRDRARRRSQQITVEEAPPKPRTTATVTRSSSINSSVRPILSSNDRRVQGNSVQPAAPQATTAPSRIAPQSVTTRSSFMNRNPPVPATAAAAAPTRPVLSRRSKVFDQPTPSNIVPPKSTSSRLSNVTNPKSVSRRSNVVTPTAHVMKLRSSSTTSNPSRA